LFQAGDPTTTAKKQHYRQRKTLAIIIEAFLLPANDAGQAFGIPQFLFLKVLTKTEGLYQRIKINPL
jgi:hypothetical protein